jgi:hypothetical protein
MNSTQHTQNVSSGGGMSAVHLLLTQGEVKLMVENPEQVMEEIRLRAEQVSSVLESILMEPHGQPRWGINE